MKTIISTLALLAALAAPGVGADDRTTRDAALGGGVGGALGGAIGAEIGDRKGAIVGAAVGAGLGAAVATDREPDGQKSGAVVVVPVVVGDGHLHGRHCPPGQAKKGRC